MRLVRRIFFKKGWNQDLELGLAALDRADLATAERHLARARSRADKMFSKRDPRRLETLEALGRLRQAQWDPQGSDLQLEAYKLRRKAHGADHAATASALLALVGDDVWGKVTDGQLIEQAASFAQSLGRNTSRYANILGKLSQVRNSPELLDSAEQICGRIYGRQVDTTMPPVARHLAELALQARRPMLAAAFLRHSLRLHEAKFGARSAQAAAILHQLGQVVMLEYDFEKAELYLRKAREFSSDLEIVASLGGCLHAQGRFEQAEECYRIYLTHAETSQGLNSPRVAQSLHHLMTVLYARGEVAQAEAVLTRLLNLEARASKETRLEIADRLRLFGHCSNSQAEKALREATRITEQVLGRRHARTAQLQKELADHLGETREARGLAKAAERRLRKANPATRAALEVSERKLGRYLGYWAHLCWRTGDREQADRLARRAQQLCDHPGLERFLQPA